MSKYVKDLLTKELRDRYNTLDSALWIADSEGELTDDADGRQHLPIMITGNSTHYLRCKRH